MATTQTLPGGGGFISKLFGGKSETASEKYAREDAEFRAKHPEKFAPKEQPKPAPKQNGLDGLIGGALIKSMADREKAAGLAKGGPVKSIIKGGAIKGQGGPTEDKVPLMGSNGEFMIKASSAKIIGPEMLEALNALGDGEPKAQKQGAIRKLAGGGPLLNEEQQRLQRIGQIPTGGTAPAPDGYDNGNDFTRNVNTSLNALGGMGVVASVPLRAATAGRAAASGLGAIQNSMRAPALLANGVSGPNFIAGANSVRQVGGANLPTVMNAAEPVYKTVNVALQEGAKANQMAAGTRSLGNASAGLGMLDGQQAPIMPGAPAQPQAATQLAGGAPQLAQNNQPDYQPYGEKWTKLGEMLNYSSDREAMKARQAATSNPAEDARNARAQAAASAQPAAAGALPAKPAAPGTKPATTAQVATLPADPNAITNQVTRVGNSYSGGNVAGDISINGKSPTGGVISAQNNQAAENLARRYGQTEGFGPSGAIRGGGTVSSMDTSQGYASNLRQLAAFDKQKADQNALIEQNQEQLQVQSLEGKALRGNPAALAMLKDRMNASSGRMTDQTTRRGQDLTAGNQGAVNKLAQDKFGLDSQGTKLDNEQKQLSMGILKTLLDPKATPEQKAQATAQLQAMAGKTQETLKPFAVTGGQTVIDGQAITQPSMVFDPTTRQFINPNQGAQQGGIQADQRAIAIRDNPNLSREQKVAELKKIGFQ